MSQTIAGAPRSSWADDWDPAPPPPRPAATARTTSPRTLVTAYYAALDAHRFADAWAVLAPGVRRRFGGFAHWRAGYATTLSSHPRQLHVTPSGPASWTISHVVVARDETACGATLERRFTVRWRVTRAAGGWSVTALGATLLAGRRACS